MDIKTEKNKFLKNEITTLSIDGGFSRGYVYRKDLEQNDKDRKKFKKYIRKLISEYNVKFTDEYNKYSSEQLEKKCIEDIQNFKKELNNKFKDRNILKDNNFRIGTSQKILNLYLKYLWCLGYIEYEPPHCPLDSTIIKDCLKENVKWTEIDEIKEYLRLIEKSKKCAGNKNQTIAQWELKEWNDKIINNN